VITFTVDIVMELSVKKRLNNRLSRSTVYYDNASTILATDCNDHNTYMHTYNNTKYQLK